MTPEEFEKEAKRLIREIQEACWKRGEEVANG